MYLLLKGKQEWLDIKTQLSADDIRKLGKENFFVTDGPFPEETELILFVTADGMLLTCPEKSILAIKEILPEPIRDLLKKHD